MYHHSCQSCQSCTQSSQNTQANSLSDFFPAGYRVTSAHERFPYYISVPVFLEEEEDNSCNNNCGCNQNCGCSQNCGSCCCVQTCCCPCPNGGNLPCTPPASGSPSCGCNRIRCTTRFCR